MHPTVVFDGDDRDQRTRAYAAFDAILELGLSLGGTITGEHGVGILKAGWLEREIGPVSLSVHQAIKGALDPAGLLNPGKLFRRANRADLAAVGGLPAGA
jgi:glycolate oxidase